MKRKMIRYASIFGIVLAFCSVTMLTSCSDDIKDIKADVEIPEENNLSDGMEAYNHDLSFTIESDSKWHVEFDDEGDEIAYVWPRSGSGDATVKLCVMMNTSDVSRKGTMTIVFPENTKKNKIIPIVQKAFSASDDNYDVSKMGQQNYGIGFGYNIETGLNVKKSMKLCVVMPEYLRAEGKISPTADSEFKLTTRSYFGSTVSEMKSDFEAKAEFSGGACGFSAEVNATFDMNHFSNEEYEYAMTYVDVMNERIMIMSDPVELSEEECLTPGAYKALNNINGRYPSDAVGFAKLIKSYGTHVICKATLGGRLKIATKINTSKVTKEYSLQAFAKASYSGVVDVSASVDENYKQSYEENKNSCETTVSAVGGKKQYAAAMATLTGDALKENVKSWIDDIANDEEKSAVYIGIDNQDDLVPIYELVQDPERAELLKEYIESGAYQKEVEPAYNLGIQARISEVSDLIKKMNGNDYKGTLVKKICIGDNNNKTVAVLCSEYIPEIDEKGRVAVFYPVINGETKYNMGLFVGNEYHKPSRVSNYGGKMKILPYADNELGEGISIYFRGPSVTLEPIDPETPILEANIEDYKVSMWKSSKAYDYPVVKVRNNLWIRETYASNSIEGGATIGYYQYYQGSYYYEIGRAPYTVPGKGWSLPTVDDANTLLTLLNKYGINGYDAFKTNGLFGIDAENLGYVRAYYPKYSLYPSKYYYEYQGDRSCFALQKPSGYVYYPCLLIGAGTRFAKIETYVILQNDSRDERSAMYTSVRFVKPIR